MKYSSRLIIKKTGVRNQEKNGVNGTILGNILEVYTVFLKYPSLSVLMRVENYLPE